MNRPSFRSQNAILLATLIIFALSGATSAFGQAFFEDFETGATGDPVVGLTGLEITASYNGITDPVFYTGPAAQDADPATWDEDGRVYGAPNFQGSPNPVNGCIGELSDPNSQRGFSYLFPPTANRPDTMDSLVYRFEAAAPLEFFEVEWYDVGDFFPFNTSVDMVHTIEYRVDDRPWITVSSIRTTEANGRSTLRTFAESIHGADFWADIGDEMDTLGDACTGINEDSAIGAQNSFGRFSLRVNAASFTSVEIRFPNPESIDPNHGFDNLRWAVAPPVEPCTDEEKVPDWSQIGALPDTIQFQVHADGTFGAGDPSYLDLSIPENSAYGALSGDEFDAWCVDKETGISTNTLYNAAVVPAYDENGDFNPNMPAIYGGDQQAFDSVAWLINNLPAGYQARDVQAAIWMLVHGYSVDHAELVQFGNFDPVAAQQYHDDAANNGDGFEPTCEQVIPVVFVPQEGSDVSHQPILAQSQFITIGADCKCPDEICVEVPKWTTSTSTFPRIQSTSP